MRNAGHDDVIILWHRNFVEFHSERDQLLMHRDRVAGLHCHWLSIAIQHNIDDKIKPGPL